jgi:hypothetical protein
MFVSCTTSTLSLCGSVSIKRRALISRSVSDCISDLGSGHTVIIAFHSNSTFIRGHSIPQAPGSLRTIAVGEVRTPASIRLQMVNNKKVVSYQEVCRSSPDCGTALCFNAASFSCPLAALAFRAACSSSIATLNSSEFAGAAATRRDKTRTCSSEVIITGGGDKKCAIYSPNVAYRKHCRGRKM